MPDKTTQIAQRFEEFGIQLCGSSHGWKKLFAQKLGVSPNHITDILGMRAAIGGKTQARLRELGCDVEWLLTGRRAGENSDAPTKAIHYHADKPVTPELQKRAERIVQKFIDHPTADMALIEKIIDDLLDGK